MLADLCAWRLRLVKNIQKLALSRAKLWMCFLCNCFCCNYWQRCEYGIVPRPHPSRKVQINIVTLLCAARWGSQQAVWSSMSALMCCILAVMASRLSTCRFLGNSKCSPTNTSTQCLADEKPFSRSPTVAPFVRSSSLSLSSMFANAL